MHTVLYEQLDKCTSGETSKSAVSRGKEPQAKLGSKKSERYDTALGTKFGRHISPTAIFCLTLSDIAPSYYSCCNQKMAVEMCSHILYLSTYTTLTNEPRQKQGPVRSRQRSLIHWGLQVLVSKRYQNTAQHKLTGQIGSQYTVVRQCLDCYFFFAPSYAMCGTSVLL